MTPPRNLNFETTRRTPRKLTERLRGCEKSKGSVAPIRRAQTEQRSGSSASSLCRAGFALETRGRTNVSSGEASQPSDRQGYLGRPGQCASRPWHARSRNSVTRRSRRLGSVCTGPRRKCSIDLKWGRPIPGTMFSRQRRSRSQQRMYLRCHLASPGGLPFYTRSTEAAETAKAQHILTNSRQRSSADGLRCLQVYFEAWERAFCSPNQ